MSELDRRVVVSRLVADRKHLVVVTGLGSPTYDVAAAGDSDRNFYLWGAMGGAATVGLGLALARPDTPVLVVTGDGEMLMGMGGFATIAVQKPANLRIAVLDNGLYGETGGQLSHTRQGVDLGVVARGCGIADVRTITTMDEVATLADQIHAVEHGPIVAVIKIKPTEPQRVLPSRDGPYLKSRLRAAFGLNSM